MPYRVEHHEGKRPWKIINEDTGRVVGSSTTEEAARASIRARYAGEPKEDSRHAKTQAQRSH